MKNKFLAPAIFSAFLVSALPVSAYALDGAICDKDAYPSLAGQVQCLKDKLSAVMDKIGSTDPSASKEDLAKISESLNTQISVLKDEQAKQIAQQGQTIAQQGQTISQLQNALDNSKVEQAQVNAQVQTQLQLLVEAKPKDDTPTGTTKTFFGDASAVPAGWVRADGLYFSAKEHPNLAAFVKDAYGPSISENSGCYHFDGVKTVSDYDNLTNPDFASFVKEWSDPIGTNDYQIKRLAGIAYHFCTLKEPYSASSIYGVNFRYSSSLYMMPTFKDPATGTYLIMKD